MTVRLVLLCGCLLPAAGCLENGYSGSPHALPTTAIPNSTAKPPKHPNAEPRAEEKASLPAAESPPVGAAAASALPIKDITFDDIKFEIEKDAKFQRSMLTPKIEELAGRALRIRGYILPTFQQSGIRNFVLVRDNMECCFGPGAAIYDCIIVDMTGPGAEFTTRPVTVEGVLSFREVLDFDGITRAIYHLEATGVK